MWGHVIESLAYKMPSLVGGSADLEPSNNTGGFASMVRDFTRIDHAGRNFAYGVREFPMGAINNGIAQHGGLKVFGATFFTFSDYERPAIRLRALQKLPVITEYTHDSIYVGEDGPTHQPVEHLMAARVIPNLLVLRPSDATEAVVCSQIALEQVQYPSLVLLSRQNLDILDRVKYTSANNARKGAYIISNSKSKPEIIIFSSGSEVPLSIKVQQILNKIPIRVISMPCWELFEMQSNEYKNKILDNGKAMLVSVEAGITSGWEKYTGRFGLNIGIDTFGESAPGHVVADYFGLTPEKVAKRIFEEYQSR